MNKEDLNFIKSENINIIIKSSLDIINNFSQDLFLHLVDHGSGSCPGPAWKFPNSCNKFVSKLSIVWKKNIIEFKSFIGNHICWDDIVW